MKFICKKFIFPKAYNQSTSIIMHLSECIIFLFTAYMLISWSQQKINIVLADDAPGLDLNALASIASNLGSNPQILNLVTSFLNQNVQKPPSSNQMITNNPSETLSDPSTNYENNVSQQQQQQQQIQAPPQAQSDSSSIAQNDTKRTNPVTSSVALTTVANNQQGATQSPMANVNPLNGLMSLLPNILPGLNNLLVPPKQQNNYGQQQTSAQASIGQTASANQQTLSLSSANNNSTSSMTIPSNIGSNSNTNSNTNTFTSHINSISNSNSNSAQSVINQVLSAYLSGQIPNELLQLGLSGRIPPQLIELALSGQVPAQMIQMVITGQVPISTINAFLATMQTNNNHASSSSHSSSTEQKSSSNNKYNEQSAPTFSLTKLIFEGLFNRFNVSNSRDSSNSIKVPTLLGPVALPNMRRWGQIVGGTITNVASIIPF